MIETFPLAGGGTVHGKTGTAYPRRADGRFNLTRGWGWFVGWAERDGRTVLFARLTRDDGKEAGPTGLRTRDALLRELPDRLAALPR